MTCGIYMIQNLVNGKIYIGQAVDIERRWGVHKSELRGNYHDNKHLQSAWNKDGESNFEFTIICECDENQLNTKEIDYIAKLKTYNPDFGYNKTYGGEGGRPTEETRRKQSESLKGENHPMYGKHHSEEARRKQSEANKGENNPFYGKHHSAETKRKISENNGSRRPEVRAKIKGSNNGWYGKHGKDNPQSIPIVQLNKDEHLIRIWESSMEAERNGGFGNSNINHCLKGRQKTYKGYKWMYLSEYMDKYCGIIV